MPNNIESALLANEREGELRQRNVAKVGTNVSYGAAADPGDMTSLLERVADFLAFWDANAGEHVEFPVAVRMQDESIADAMQLRLDGLRAIVEAT